MPNSIILLFRPHFDLVGGAENAPLGPWVVWIPWGLAVCETDVLFGDKLPKVPIRVFQIVVHVEEHILKIESVVCCTREACLNL